jgi:hypothetical protein
MTTQDMRIKGMPTVRQLTNLITNDKWSGYYALLRQGHDKEAVTSDWSSKYLHTRVYLKKHMLK